MVVTRELLRRRWLLLLLVLTDNPSQPVLVSMRVDFRHCSSFYSKGRRSERVRARPYRRHVLLSSGMHIGDAASRVKAAAFSQPSPGNVRSWHLGSIA